MEGHELGVFIIGIIVGACIAGIMFAANYDQRCEERDDDFIP